jgi:hypothetical protein
LGVKQVNIGFANKPMCENMKLVQHTTNKHLVFFTHQHLFIQGVQPDIANIAGHIRYFSWLGSILIPVFFCGFEVQQGPVITGERR